MNAAQTPSPHKLIETDAYVKARGGRETGIWGASQRAPHEGPHLEGHDEDDAGDGGDADEPAPPDGGDDHRGEADDEQGARQPEHLGQRGKVKVLL